MPLIYKHQTLIISLNFTKIINLFFKSDWLITMLFQGQQRCWPRNMSHLVKSGSASPWANKLFYWSNRRAVLKSLFLNVYVRPQSDLCVWLSVYVRAIQWKQCISLELIYFLFLCREWVNLCNDKLPTMLRWFLNTLIWLYRLQYKFIRNEYIVNYGLKKKMQTIRIFYLVESAQCKY